MNIFLITVPNFLYRLIFRRIGCLSWHLRCLFQFVCGIWPYIHLPERSLKMPWRLVNLGQGHTFYFYRYCKTTASWSFLYIFLYNCCIFIYRKTFLSLPYYYVKWCYWKDVCLSALVCSIKQSLVRRRLLLFFFVSPAQVLFYVYVLKAKLDHFK